MIPLAMQTSFSASANAASLGMPLFYKSALVELTNYSVNDYFDLFHFSANFMPTQMSFVATSITPAGITGSAEFGSFYFSPDNGVTRYLDLQVSASLMFGEVFNSTPFEIYGTGHPRVQGGIDVGAVCDKATLGALSCQGYFYIWGFNV